MRPDEHKKKKNTAYKKKYGIPNKSSNEVTGTEKEKVGSKKHIDKQDISSKSHQQPPPASKDKYRGQAQALPTSSESSSDSEVSKENSQKVPKRKEFSRRQIVSNWQKYELEPETEGKVTARGQKYETLINMAGEAMSRFRFRDELEWEDKPSPGDPTCPTEEYQSCLSINPADLTQSLSCIPVHRLLDVEEDLFPNEQLESIIQAANKNCAMYSTKEEKYLENDQSQSQLSTHTHERVEPSTIDTNVPSPTHGGLNNAETTTALKTINSSNLTPQLYAKAPHSTNNSESKIKDSNKRINDKSLQQQTSSSSEQRLTLQDDDLDRLLDMDLETDEKAVDGSSITTNGKTLPSVNCQGNDLQDKKNDNESEDLEEWLDGILD